MATLKGKKYPEQIAHLKENFGFSQAHANALVMYSRGSTSSRRFETPSEYFKTLSPEQRKTIKAIFAAITSKYPKLELVIAWNQPMQRLCAFKAKSARSPGNNCTCHTDTPPTCGEAFAAKPLTPCAQPLPRDLSSLERPTS